MKYLGGIGVLLNSIRSTYKVPILLYIVASVLFVMLLAKLHNEVSLPILTKGARFKKAILSEYITTIN